ncbi:Fusaric acid resistance protein-like, putative [Leishmania donovani]|uniref:Fusaric acid resistance protein-like, putative n=1 Tax=Leishmania donovani TaxID=5661 RepID=A0A3Q8IJB5_LEIDO|nr:Fusaric acid resistance protein-like, putative [Leishmania donovani]
MSNHFDSDDEPIFTPKEGPSRNSSDVVEAELHPNTVVPANTSTSTKDPLTSSNATTVRHESKIPPPPLPLQVPEPSTPATVILAGPPGAKSKSFSVHNKLSPKQAATSTPIATLRSAAEARGAPGKRTANGIDCSDSFVNDDDVSLDSCGIPRYNARYPQGGSGSHGDVSVPWNLRPPMRRINCTFFDFLRAPQFWRQFEFAIRITVLGVLVPGALIAAELPGSPFVSPFMVFASILLATKRTAGEVIAYIFIWIRAGCFWLPLSVIAGALSLGHHFTGWCIYYSAMLFIIATFTEGVVRRICLLLFNSCTVGLLVDSNRGAVFPCRVMVDWCIGTGLCVVVAFFPYPLFCKREAQRLLRDIGRNTATAYRGLVYSFWSPSNVERNMAMSKVRIMTDSLDVLLPLFEHNQSFSFYEFLFEPAEVREIRALKFALFERLRINLSSMTRVLDMVEAKPSAIDDSDRSKAFGELLNPHLNAVAEVFDELLDLLTKAKTRKALLGLQERFECFADRTDDLQDAFKLARRTIFYEYTSGILEEFVPLMTFYIFTVVCVRDTIDIFQTKVKAHHPSVVSTMEQIWIKTAWEPLKENLHFLKKLFTEWNRREVQRVVEAAKVSVAMILTIGFSYLIKVDKASFSGPNIIAFVSGSNPVEAVQESIVRLTGCLLGTVLGFFAGTYSETPVQRVASLCTLIFFGTFLRFDKEYGIMAVYGMFVLIPLISIAETTVEDTVSRMNQNTFGIFIYLFVSVLVLPLSPSLILRAKRSNVLRCMASVVSSMMGLFSEPLVNDPVLNNHSIMGIHETEDEQLSQNVGGGDGQLPSRGTLTNRSLHLLSKTDTAMVQIDKQLVELMRRLKSTKEMMKFARDERTLVEVDYPIKACEQTYLHMYRMTMLLQTMWMSWNVIRSQRTYTEGTRRMMRNLQPVAHDVAGAFQRFVDLMCYMIREPSINLEGDIMKAVFDLIEAANVLHCRKSQIMLMLINQSVQDYAEANDAGDISGGGSSKIADPGTHQQPDLRDLQERGQRSIKGAVAVSTSGEHSQQLRSQPHSPGLRHSPWLGYEASRHSAHPFAALTLRPSMPRAATFDGLFSHFTHLTPVTSPTGQGYNFQVLASERNVSVVPYLRRAGTKEASEHSSHQTSPVHLPATFQFPLTSEDVEGLHSFTLSMEMFANETKLLMVSIGAMLDNLRSKL